VLLNARLSPDMFPLLRQVREATNHAAIACGRLAGVDLLTFANTEASISELLKVRIRGKLLPSEMQPVPMHPSPR